MGVLILKDDQFHKRFKANFETMQNWNTEFKWRKTVVGDPEQIELYVGVIDEKWYQVRTIDYGVIGNTVIFKSCTTFLAIFLLVYGYFIFDWQSKNLNWETGSENV